MAISLLQKIRLWWRGASRRREEREREFLTRNQWGSNTPAPAAAPAVSAPAKKTLAIDREGLQAAYLDGSGRIAYYLDTLNGEVVETRDGSALAAPRFLRVPMQSDDDDRAAFLASLGVQERARLAASPSFRSALAEERTLERAWYNFKNDRATAAIEEWLRKIGGV